MPEQGNILAQLALILWVPDLVGPLCGAQACARRRRVPPRSQPPASGSDRLRLPRLAVARRRADRRSLRDPRLPHLPSRLAAREAAGPRPRGTRRGARPGGVRHGTHQSRSRLPRPRLASSHDNLRWGVAGPGPDPYLRRSVLSRARPRPANDTGPCVADHSRGGGADLFVADPLRGSHEPAAARHRLRLQPAPVDADDSFRWVETDGLHGARAGPCAVRAHHESRRGRALETGAPHPAEASRAGCSLSDGHPGAVQEPGNARLWRVHPADRSLRAAANPAHGWLPSWQR